MTSTYSLKNVPRRMAGDGERDANRYENLVLALSRRAERIVQEHGKRLQQFWADAADAYGRIAASAKDRDSVAGKFDAHCERMRDAGQPMDEFEPAVKALDPKQG
jgi:hypothetical protein